jgi:GSH-dependent disulfide-bond oxidoreductase
MIDLYTWTTPNGWKASIMLEELGLPYQVHAINISKGEQHTPEFLAINPNGKIPAIVDQDGPDGKPIAIFESGAIAIYLAEKTGSPLLPTEPRARAATLQWSMFQMAGVGPMFGQAHHFLLFAKEDVPYGKNRYHTETKRLYGVMDKRLGEVEYLAGADYSIADILTYPWVHRHERHQVDLDGLPNVKRWYEAVGARPAVQQGLKAP